MKKLLMLFLLLGGTLFAQNWGPVSTRTDQINRAVKNKIPYLGQDTAKVWADLMYVVNWDSSGGASEGTLLDIKNLITTLNGLVSTSAHQITAQASLTSIDNNTKVAASFFSGSITVLTSATQLSATSVPCKYVTIVNNTVGAVLYVGGSGVTTSDGTGALQYLDDMTIQIDNLNKVYLVATVSTNCRYSYGN